MNDSVLDREDVVILYLAKYMNESDHLRPVAVSACITLIVLCLATHSVLLVYLRTAGRSGSELAPDQAVVLAMAVCAMVFSPAGLISSLILSLHQTFDDCVEHLETLSLWTVFFCFATNIHLVMLMHLIRYHSIVTDPLARVSNKAVHVGIATVVTYTLLTSILAFVPKLLMSLGVLSRTSSLRRVATITTVSVWITVCVTVKLTVTLLIIRRIRRQQREVQAVLHNQSRAIDTKRLKVIFVQGVFYMIIWSPFGIVVGQKSNIDLRTYVLAVYFFTVFMHASILILPVMYYFLDKKFEGYINQKFPFKRKQRPRENIVSSEITSAASSIKLPRPVA